MRKGRKVRPVIRAGKPDWTLWGLHGMAGYRSGLILAGALAAFAIAPARADVKDGADAWSRGDYPAAIAQWQAPAEAGDPDAQFNMAQAYRLGRGVPRDLARSEALYGKAAAQGHVQAADNYGLLLFDRGDRVAALPYVRAAADRGDPRAQYLMGIAHFNGDIAPKDWRRAYALMTLAQASGLPQASPALAQMDQHIPLAERQAAATLATRISAETEARRSALLASADLTAPSVGTAPAPATARPVTKPPVVAVAAPTIVAPALPRPAVPAPRPETAVAAATRTAAGSTPATAGADYARPAVTMAPAARPAPPAPAPKPVAAPKPAPVAVTATPKPAPLLVAKPAGPWRVQLGAFGVAANADGLWNKVRGRPELSGHGRIDVPVGKVLKLQAGGFASRDAASAACAALAKGGFTCIAAQD
jgi:TPR repeat protein